MKIVIFSYIFPWKELNEEYNSDTQTKYGFTIDKYDESKFIPSSFSSINFDELSKKAMATKRTKDNTQEIELMLEGAEEMVDGKWYTI